jgi:hypothetical protein
VRDRLALVGLAGVAVAARLPLVRSAALSQDEVASARILREATPLAALHRVVRTESTPPLWYALGWLAHHAGVPILDVRLLSVAFGALLTAGVYLLGAALLPRAFAAGAALLVALGYEPVFHGAELRAYELLALLAVVFAGLLLLELGGRGVGIPLALVTAAGLLTHYFFALTVVAALAWLWLEPSARALRRRATLAIAAGGALAAPWLPAFVQQYRQDRFWWIGPFSARAVAVTPLRFFTPLGVHHIVIGLGVAALLAMGTVELARRSPGARLVALLAVVPIVLAAAMWAGGMHVYAARNLIGAAPFAALAGAALAASLPRPAAVAAVAAGLAAVGLVWISQASLPGPAFGTLARTLVAEGWGPRDPIAVYGNFFEYRAPLEWYLPHGPTLDVSRMRSGDCETLFVIAGRRAAHSLPARDVYAERRAGGFTIARLGKVRAHALRGATLLASASDAPSCVRLSSNPRFAPLA